MHKLLIVLTTLLLFLFCIWWNFSCEFGWFTVTLYCQFWAFCIAQMPSTFGDVPRRNCIDVCLNCFAWWHKKKKSLKRISFGFSSHLYTTGDVWMTTGLFIWISHKSHISFSGCPKLRATIPLCEIINVPTFKRVNRFISDYLLYLN